MCVCEYICVYMHGRIREQLSKVGFLIQLLCGFWVLNSGHQTYSASILTCCTMLLVLFVTLKFILLTVRLGRKIESSFDS